MHFPGEAKRKKFASLWTRKMQGCITKMQTRFKNMYIKNLTPVQKHWLSCHFFTFFLGSLLQEAKHNVLKNGTSRHGLLIQYASWQPVVDSDFAVEKDGPLAATQPRYQGLKVLKGPFIPDSWVRPFLDHSKNPLTMPFIILTLLGQF